MLLGTVALHSKGAPGVNYRGRFSRGGSPARVTARAPCPYDARMADTHNGNIVLLDRNSILNADDSRRELVHVPEWGGSLYVKSLTGAERDRFESSIQATKTGDTKLNLSNFRSKLVVLAACDSNGGRLFGDTDITALGQRNAQALQRVFEVAQRLCGMTKEDVEELTGESSAETDSFDGGSV